MTTRPGQRTLTEVLEIEYAQVVDGEAPRCGADHHGDTVTTCDRRADHEEAGEHSRESHAALITGEGRYWLTWVNVPDGRLVLAPPDEPTAP